MTETGFAVKFHLFRPLLDVLIIHQNALLSSQEEEPCLAIQSLAVRHRALFWFFSYLRRPRLMYSGVPFMTECNTDSHFSTVPREFYDENEAKWCLSAFPSDRLGHPDYD